LRQGRGFIPLNPGSKKKGRRRKENGNRKLGERWKCK
jgi:hypothetical protein